MNETDKAYFAGILDGEGSIMLSSQGKGRKAPCVSVTSTDYELIEYLDNLYHGSICKNKKYKETYSQSWEWKIRNRVALQALKDAYPYLKIKRKQKRAKLLLDDYLACTPRNGRYTPEAIEAKNALIQKFATL